MAEDLRALRLDGADFQRCKVETNRHLAHLGYDDLSDWWSDTEVDGVPAYLAIFDADKRERIIAAARACEEARDG